MHPTATTSYHVETEKIPIIEAPESHTKTPTGSASTDDSWSFPTIVVCHSCDTDTVSVVCGGHSTQLIMRD